MNKDKKTCMIVMGCDQCVYERTMENMLVPGATLGCFPTLNAARSMKRESGTGHYLVADHGRPLNNGTSSSCPRSRRT